MQNHLALLQPGVLFAHALNADLSALNSDNLPEGEDIRSESESHDF